MAGGARRTIVRPVSGLALALHLALATQPPLGPPPPRMVPPLDPGPFAPRELAASTGGVLLGDFLVLGAGYEALELFAAHTIQPTAGNFRTAAYSLGVAAMLVPPLAAALFAHLARAEPASGSFWKAALLAFAGQAVAVGAGLLAYPRIWVIVPVQILAIGIGASAGLHWGPGLSARGADRGAREEPRDPAPPPAARAAAGICPDPAAATVG
jgi:hypothetical protein